MQVLFFAPSFMTFATWNHQASTVNSIRKARFHDAIGDGRISVFRGLSPEQLALLRPMFVRIFHPTGYHIFEQGDQAVFFYILMSGEIAIRYKPEDGPVLTVPACDQKG